MTSRTTAHSRHGAVAVTPHHEATAAALHVMRSGGNAADAVIAANAVLGVVLPTTCGIGGDLFAIVHRPGMERPEVLNASGRGGSGLDAAALRRAGNETMPLYSAPSVTVPGCVDGWEQLADRHGALPLAESLATSVSLARDGFAASQELATALAAMAVDLVGQPSAAALYPGGDPPEPEATLRRHDLAETMQGIAEQGRAALYEGATAKAIAAATDGILTVEDLAENAADWVMPLGIEVFGLQGWTVPPNSQGYLTLAACWLMEGMAPPRDPTDPRFHHAAIEAYRAVAWERDDLVADPDYLADAAEALLDEERLTARLAALDPDRTIAWPHPSPALGGTAFFCAVDGAGMAVSCIQSNFAGIGARISAGTTGIFLHNRGAGFSLRPGHPNEAAPGKRPLHTLSPTLWTRGTETALVLGTRGGHQQPQYLTQVAAALLYAGLEPAAAQSVPRWHIEEAGTPQPTVVSVEADMPSGVLSGLATAGHEVTIEPERAVGWGPVSIIAVGRDGSRTGSADPRVSTATAAGV